MIAIIGKTTCFANIIFEGGIPIALFVKYAVFYNILFFCLFSVVLRKLLDTCPTYTGLWAKSGELMKKYSRLQGKLLNLKPEELY
jgi:hypothetical protein